MINNFKKYNIKKHKGKSNPFSWDILDSGVRGDRDIIEYIKDIENNKHFSCTLLYHRLSRKVRLFIKMRGFKIDNRIIG